MLPAFRGHPGRNGANASSPTAGIHAQNIAVGLSYDGSLPGEIHVSRGGYVGGYVCDIGCEDRLFLNCRGGDGGNGGHGQDGQQGGRGRDGADATRWSEAGVRASPLLI